MKLRLLLCVIVAAGAWASQQPLSPQQAAALRGVNAVLSREMDGLLSLNSNNTAGGGHTADGAAGGPPRFAAGIEEGHEEGMIYNGGPGNGVYLIDEMKYPRGL